MHSSRMRTAGSSSCHGGSPSPPPEQTPPGAGPLPLPSEQTPTAPLEQAPPWPDPPQLPPWVWAWTRSPSTSPLVVGLGQIPLNFPLGCGPGPDPLNFPLGCGPGDPAPFWRLAARHAGIPPIMHAGIPPHPPPPTPVNRITDRCKNITLPQTSFAGGKNVNVANLESVTGKLNSVCDCKIAKSSFRQSL